CCRSACGPLPPRPLRPARPASPTEARKLRPNSPCRKVSAAPRIELVDTADMTITTITPGNFRLRSTVAASAIVLAVLAGSGVSLHAQTVACMVTGEPITNLDIEQRSKLN